MRQNSRWRGLRLGPDGSPGLVTFDAQGRERAEMSLGKQRPAEPGGSDRQDDCGPIGTETAVGAWAMKRTQAHVAVNAQA